MLRVEGVLLDAVEEPKGMAERLAVGGGAGILREGVEGEPQGVELLLGVEGPALGIEAPVDAAVVRVDEAGHEVVLGAPGHFEVLRSAQHAVGG